MKSLVDMETGYRGFLLTGAEASLQPFKDGRAALENKHLAGVVNKCIRQGMESS